MRISPLPALEVESQKTFWQEHPALLYGVCLLVGTSCALFASFPWNGLFLLGFCGYLLALRFPWLSLLVLLSFVYSYFLYLPSPSNSPSTVYFSISSLQPHQTPFQKGLLYKGSFFIEGRSYPGSVSFSDPSHPPAYCDYLLMGKLIPKSDYEYSFKPKEWVPVENTFSLAEWRYQKKEAFRKFLQKKLPSPKTSIFLSSLITGDVEDRLLRFEFGRLGLQHLLAISGFHFGLLLAFCSFFLRLFFPPRVNWLLLLLLLNLYFLFVGTSPAVQRSWLTAELYLLSKLLNRQTTGLNLLGVALCAELLLHPLNSCHVGFQLSYVSCLGILLFYPRFEESFASLFPKRGTKERNRLSFAAKHGALLSSFLRQAFSITCAVNVALVPFLLYHFHQFPWLSLIYNLFIPFLVGVALFFLLLALTMHLLWPPLASYLFMGTDFFTRQLLDFVSYPPSPLDFVLYIPSFPGEVLWIYLAFLLYVGIQIRQKKELLLSMD